MAAARSTATRTVAERRQGKPLRIVQPAAPTVLRCATPEEYWLWAGKRGQPPAIIHTPSRQFCRDADPAWCRAERAAGRCCLSDAEFIRVHDDEPEEEEPVGRLPMDRSRSLPAAASMSIAPEGWDVWLGGGGRSAAPTVTITHQGDISVNAAADQLLGKPATVQLLFKRAEQLIGVRACAADAPGAITLKSRPARNGFRIKAGPFLAHHGIPMSVTRRWRVEVTDRMLVARIGEPPSWSAVPRRAA